MLFAITDIETTGGHAASNGITEIAVRIYDGNQVLQSWETLVNPGISIPDFIQKLTGITPEMVALAPRFEAIAPQLFELLQGKVFVAHNVNFDFSFLNHLLQQQGYELTCPRLCTVRYSRKLFPGLRSYSLGNLCRHFGIPVHNRHRAGGDATATVALLQHLRQHDRNNHLHTLLRKQSGEHYLPMHLNRTDVDQLPAAPGVYYFYDVKGKVIYVGKAVNLKKRVLSHFTSNNTSRQRQDFIREVQRISFTQCGSELMAAILETIEIRRLWPRYNKAAKKQETVYGFYTYENNAGYLQLVVERKKQYLPAWQYFYQLTEAHTALKEMANQWHLCYKRCNIDRSYQATCSAAHCKSGCTVSEQPDQWNQRLLQALEAERGRLPAFLIREPAWQEQEDVCVLVHNGRFYGMGCLPKSQQVLTLDAARTLLQPYPEYDAVRNLVRKQVQRFPQRIVPLME